MWRNGVVVVGLVVLLASCAPAPAPSVGAPGPAPQANPQLSRTLVFAVRFEPNSLAARPLAPQAIASYLPRRLFNADLAILDAEGVPRPYLAAALPQLNTDTWRVFPDGRMETTYQLKPDLTWHNGSPLTSADFVFGWRVYATPGFGGATVPFSLIEDVTAPDPLTVVIRWKRLFADAGALQSVGSNASPFPPLPRAILEDAFASDPEGLVTHTFWTQGYVGLGPYRLAQWDPGSSYVATAFEKHTLGTPKIERLQVRVMADGNAVLASMLAGDVHFAADVGLQVSHVPLLLSQWPAGRGTAIQHPNQWRVVYIQLRPEYSNPRGLLDRRVRQALTHAIDRVAIADSVYEGQAPSSDSMIPPTTEIGRAADAVTTKYPFDVRRSAELMTQAGYTRGGDGVWTHPSDGRFVTEFKTNAGVNFEAEMSALGHAWGQAGFTIQEVAVPTAMAQDPEVRGAYPGLFGANTNVGEGTAAVFNTANIGRSENRWTGGNRSGFSHPQYDQLVDAFSMSLERAERGRLLVDMVKLFSEELPAIPLSFQPQPWVHISEVTGPKLVAAESNMAWNIHEWEFH